MNNRWRVVPILALMTAGVTFAGSGVTVISVNNLHGAWVGYSDGAVRFCNGGGGTVVPFWTTCTTAVEASGSSVMDISNNDRRAWIGHADGRLRYCRESGSDRHPMTECIDVKGDVR